MRVFYRRDDAEPMTVRDALIACLVGLVVGWIGVKIFAIF